MLRSLPGPLPLILLALALSPKLGMADIEPPAGWFSGDLHVHWPRDCYGVAAPESILARMPADLNLASVLLWGGGGYFEQNAADYFTGQDDPVSTPEQIVHYDLELSAFNLADRLGHVAYHGLENVNFPQSTYHGGMAPWARSQGAVIGSLHSQAWTWSLDLFPEFGECCTPYELPVDMALGRVDYLDYQGPNTSRWNFIWRALLNCGFRPGIAATSDAWCLYEIGEYRTYARLDAPLSYDAFAAAVAAGRTSVVEQNHSLPILTVSGAETGDEIHVSSGQPVALKLRVIMPTGMSQSSIAWLIRNGERIAVTAFHDQPDEWIWELEDTPTTSSWYSARTLLGYTGAVYVIVDQEPIRASWESADYFVRYLDYLRGGVLGGQFHYLTPADKAALLQDIDAAQAIYEQIRAESTAPTGIGDPELHPGRAQLTAVPNPFDDRVELTVGTASQVAPLAIYGVGGQLIRRLSVGAGRRVAWDGRDERGVRVPGGVYYVRPATGGATVLVKLR